MKKHAIIPIFIPHRGCPNDCVFCNQKKITARDADVTPQSVRDTIEKYLETIRGRSLETVEAAFFGGSFTGIPIEEQSAFLAVAKEYKDRGEIDKIHISTRPDYINEEILDNLRRYGVEVIELGVQSFDEEVLAAAGRGHGVKDVEDACRLIHEYGCFTLGIQLMIGLPKDSKEKCIRSAKRAIEMKPAIARLYPTVVIKDTELAEMLKRGEYEALGVDEGVETVKEMYKLLTEAGIKVIRVGLKSTDLITNGEGGQLAAAGYHPSFRQLVESEIAREILEKQVGGLFPQIREDFYPYEKYGFAPTALFEANEHCFSNLIGYRASNKKFFADEYVRLNVRYAVNNALADGEYRVSSVTDTHGAAK